MRYRKVPVEIEAFQFYVDNIPDWFMDKVTSNEIILRNCDDKRYSIDEAYCEINTLEGVMRGNGGDYIIKGINGEIYPCKPDIFEKTYEISSNMGIIEILKEESIGERFIDNNGRVWEVTGQGGCKDKQSLILIKDCGDDKTFIGYNIESLFFLSDIVNLKFKKECGGKMIIRCEKCTEQFCTEGLFSCKCEDVIDTNKCKICESSDYNCGGGLFTTTCIGQDGVKYYKRRKVILK